MPNDHHQFLSILYRALGTPLGLELPCSDITKVRAKLYAARVASKDISLNVLEFRAAPTGKAILIVKRRREE
jgi:hypothetical protein